MRVTNEALEAGKCVVIGLQSTGDSRTKQMVQRQTEDGEEDGDALRFVPGFISSPREVLLQLIDHAFPDIQLPEAQVQPAASFEDMDVCSVNPRRNVESA